MKKISLMIVCLLAMMAASMSAKAQDITITLLPGWTWISYPKVEAMDIPTALGDFIPMEGDIIKSQFSSTSYTNGQWRGRLMQFTPGMGYHYYSMRGEPVSFVFASTAPQLTVTTTEPTEITVTSAISGGTITSNDGNYIYVYMKGICWATHPNPMVMNDSYAENGSGAESFAAEMTDLTPNTVYYVRAYVVTLNGTFYGDEFSFTTLDDGSNDHAYVDLGLPSGLLWANCNVGADSPEDYGDYFAWGETQPKDNFSWTNYQYCMGSFNTLTKYCNNPDIGYNGFTDDLTTLEPSDDAATANWGDDWRMPTDEEWQELYQNTTVTWTTRNGVNGRLFTASNGNSLFLPAAGCRYDSDLDGVGSNGNYWSSSLFFTDYPHDAWVLFFISDGFYMSNRNRDYGRSVRPVRSVSQSTSFIINATANPVEGGVVSGGGSYQFGAECTLTATANEGYIFNNWMENDSVVSTQASYQFIVTGNLTLVASFTYVQPTYSISVSTNPSVGGIVVGDGTYTEGQSCTVTAIANTNYVFTSWIENGNVVSTDATYTFSVTNDRILVANFNVVYNGHEYVDLGLPSGALWATCNVGATTPEGYGNLYSWYYNFGNMPANMPTIEQWRELANNTTGTWTNQDGVNGWLYTASNGNTLFLPAAGYQSGNAIFRRGSEGDYWSKTPTLNSNMYFVWIFNSSINSNGYSGECDYGIGCSVRQVLTP